MSAKHAHGRANWKRCLWQWLWPRAGIVATFTLALNAAASKEGVGAQLVGAFFAWWGVALVIRTYTTPPPRPLPAEPETTLDELFETTTEREPHHAR